MKKIMSQKLVIAAFLAGLILAGVAYFLNLPQQMGLPVPGVAAGGPAAEAAPTPTPKPKIGPMYPLKERIVNLADDKGKRYLKIALTLEFKPTEVEAAPEEGKNDTVAEGPIIEDAVTSILTPRRSSKSSPPRAKRGSRSRFARR